MTTIDVDFAEFIPLAHLLRDDMGLFFAPPRVNMNEQQKETVRNGKQHVFLKSRMFASSFPFSLI